MKAKKTMESLTKKSTIPATTKNFCHYLAPQMDEPQLIPHSEFRTAFVDGYISALHKTHTLTESLFCTLKPEDVVNIVKDEICAILPLIDRTKPNLITDIYEYLLTDNELIHRSSINLPNAFISGYLTGLYKSGKYDRCLFMKGYELRTQVFADLLSYETTEESARRAAARIIMNKYGSFDKTKICDIIFEESGIDDSGEGFIK